MGDILSPSTFGRDIESEATTTPAMSLYRILMFTRQCGWLLFRHLAVDLQRIAKEPNFVALEKKIVKKFKDLPLSMRMLGTLIHSKATFRDGI